MLKRTLLVAAAMVLAVTAYGQRWQLESDGQGIVWEVNQENIPHSDHIEMTGEMMSVVMRWGVDEQGAFTQERSLVFPLLRTIPNNTHASLMYRVATDIPSLLGVNGLVLQAEKVESVKLDGALIVESLWHIGKKNTGSARKAAPTPVLKMTRTIFPSRRMPMMCERYTLRNITQKPIAVSIPNFAQTAQTDPAKGVDGAYFIRTEIVNDGFFNLEPNAELTFDVICQAYRADEKPVKTDVEAELAARMDFVHGVIDNCLVLDTPDDVIDREFRFSKIRASESIINTRGGYMHAPGGESYYAAIWANDQAEYVNPFFPFLGYDVGNKSAINSFKHFARFMNDEGKPIPSSIIAEGDDFWNGAGDRGDAAMIAHGALRFAMAYGDMKTSQELWPLIKWCLDYCHSKLTPEGVVASDTDELEGRFPDGDANLCTSTLYYDALVSAELLGEELGASDAELDKYMIRARNLRAAIEKYYGAEMSGYHTYRYYDGNDVLRSWICMPLVVGIMDRKEGTVEALMSKELMTEDGLLTAAGSTTFWDRSTLYALRGIYNAGYADRATEFLAQYSRRRLLGDHVPYPIEAWPEGSQRHLSAESGLYCRIITEGMFGIRPTGMRSFNITPSMPTAWPEMSLKKMRAFGTALDITVKRAGNGKLDVVVTPEGRASKTFRIKEGATAKVDLINL